MGNALMEDSGGGAKGKGGTKKEEVVSLPDLPLELVGKVDVGTADNNNPEMDMEETKQLFGCYENLTERLVKTFYYGGDRMPQLDRFSHPMAELAVHQFTKEGSSKPTGLGKLDLDRAFDISKYLCVTPTSLVLSLIYLERLRSQNPVYLATVSSTDLFLVSLMLSSKFLHDDGEEDEVFNESWAEAGYTDIKELNDLEIDFLCAIDWKLLVSPAEFSAMTHKMESWIAYNEFNRRGGWATYSDMELFLRNLEVSKLWHILAECTWKITALCVTAYAAQLVTLLGTVYMLNKTPTGLTHFQHTLSSLLNTPKPVTSPASVSSSRTPTVGMGGVVPESHLNGSELIDYESLVDLDEDMAQVVTNFLTKTNDSGIQNGYDSKSVELDRLSDHLHSDSNHDHHPLLTSIGSFLLPSPQPPDSTSVLLEQDPRHQQQLTNQVKGKIFEIKEYWMQLPDFKIIESLRQSASKSAAASQCPLWKKLTRLNLPPWVDEMSKYSAFMDVVVGAS